MRTLVIETSSCNAKVGVIEEEKSRCEEVAFLERSQTSSLMTSLQKIDRQCSFSSLQSVVVGVGPGSYTGIRNGLSIAQTISYVYGISLFRVNSLCAFTPQSEGKYCVVVDAKGEGIYCLEGKRCEKEVVFFSYQKLTEKELLDKICDDVVWITPDKKSIEKRLFRYYPNEISLLASFQQRCDQVQPCLETLDQSKATCIALN